MKSDFEKVPLIQYNYSVTTSVMFGVVKLHTTGSGTHGTVQLNFCICLDLNCKIICKYFLRTTNYPTSGIIS